MVPAKDVWNSLKPKYDGLIMQNVIKNNNNLVWANLTELGLVDDNGALPIAHFADVYFDGARCSFALLVVHLISYNQIAVDVWLT